MSRVGSVHGSQRGDGFIEGGEAEQPLPAWQQFAGARMLHYRGLPAGEVAERAVADPRVLEADARRLDATELAPRLLDVCLVIRRRSRDFRGVADGPAVGFHQSSIAHVIRRF